MYDAYLFGYTECAMPNKVRHRIRVPARGESLLGLVYTWTVCHREGWPVRCSWKVATFSAHEEKFRYGELQKELRLISQLLK